MTQDFCTSQQRKARKEHKCVECGNAIMPKDTYNHISGCYEGDIFSVKECLSCSAVRVKVNASCRDMDLFDDDRPAFGEMYHFIMDTKSYDPDLYSKYFEETK